MTLKEWNCLTDDQRNCICHYQKLSLSFIEEIWNDLTNNQRNCICECQKLPISFIKQIWNELTEYQRDLVCQYQTLSKTFIKQVWNDLTKRQKQLVNDIHLDYPNKKERIKRAKEYAKKHNLKCDRKYLYAYRNHDKWGRGMYKYNQFYTKGQLYRDWHCDPRKEVENSFGLGIWSKGNTEVRVPLDSFVVEVNRDDGKARVEAFEVV